MLEEAWSASPLLRAVWAGLEGLMEERAEGAVKGSVLERSLAALGPAGESEEGQKGSGKEDSSSQVGLREQGSRGSEYRRPMPYRMEETTPRHGVQWEPRPGKMRVRTG